MSFWILGDLGIGGGFARLSLVVKVKPLFSSLVTFRGGVFMEEAECAFLGVVFHGVRVGSRQMQGLLEK